MSEIKTKEQILEMLAPYEKRMREEGPIYVETVEPLNKENLKELIRDVLLRNNLYSLVCLNSEGVYSPTSPKFIKSFKDKDGKNQCSVGRLRSVGDLFRIALGEYSEDITLVDIMEVIYVLIDIEYSHVGINKINGTPMYYFLYSGICSTIKRRRFSWTYYLVDKKNPRTFSPTIMDADQRSPSLVYLQDEPQIVLQDYSTLFKEKYENDSFEEVELTKEVAI